MGFITASVSCLGAPPAEYFAAANGLEGSALKAQLGSLISGHTVLSYTPGIWDAHKDMHEDPDNPANIILFYSQASISKALQDSGSPANYWNREHLWPNSYGIDDSVSRGYTDLFNLVPAYKGVNSSRGNKYFDEVSPGDPGYAYPAYYMSPECETNTVAWEPADPQKGWVARAMLYMTTRYSHLELVDTPPALSTSQNRMAQLSVMLEWNRRFLPAEKEQYVNQRVYDDYQHNRNPYIDFPEFADAVWVAGPSWGGWRLAHFSLEELLDPALSGDLADPDGDELNNLLEMALFTDPKVPDANPPFRGSVEAGTLLLSFDRASDSTHLNLQLILESSPDLESWSLVPLDGASLAPLSPGRETVTLSLPASGPDPRFYRLHALRP